MIQNGTEYGQATVLKIPPQNELKVMGRSCDYSGLNISTDFIVLNHSYSFAKNFNEYIFCSEKL
jgi:hypothetical protein